MLLAQWGALYRFFGVHEAEIIHPAQLKSSSDRCLFCLFLIFFLLLPIYLIGLLCNNRTMLSATAMKHALTILAVALAAHPTQAAVGDTINAEEKLTYTIDGITVTMYGKLTDYYSQIKQTDSQRFYDSNKAGPWTTPYSDGTEGDSLMCWTHSASNSLQYWQDIYGVFYRDTGNINAAATPARPLPNGYYSTTTASGYDAADNNVTGQNIPNAKELHIAKAFYTNWPNSGGKFSNAAEWYLKWDSTTNPSAPGGYYSEYFGNGTSARDSFITIYSNFAENTNNPNDWGTSPGHTPFTDSKAGLKEVLLPAFGFQKNADGTYTQTQDGLMPFIGIWDKKKGTGHMLSCQGFTTDSNGNLVSILVADGDDNIARLQGLYVGEKDGVLILYRDAQCTTPLYTGAEYYIGEVSYINTPEVLQNMLTEYRSKEEAAIWNGGSDIWCTQENIVDSNLPTAATGWDVHVNGSNIEEKHHGYYHSYATEGRNVRFDAHAAEDKRSITISGTVSAANIEVAAAGYEFIAGEGAELKEGANLSVLHLAGLSSEVELRLADLTLEAGSTLSSTTAISVAGDFRTLAPATGLSTRSTAAPTPRINADLDLTAAGSIELTCGVDMNGHKLSLSSDTPITLNLSPGEEKVSLFSNIGTLSIDGTDIHNGTELNTRLRLANDTPFTGYSLVYANNSLSLVIPEPSSATLSILALAALATRRRRK